MLMQTLPTPPQGSRFTAHAQQPKATCSSAHWASCRQFPNATSEQRSDAEEGYFGLLNALKPNTNEQLCMQKKRFVFNYNSCCDCARIVMMQKTPHFVQRHRLTTFLGKPENCRSRSLSASHSRIKDAAPGQFPFPQLLQREDDPSPAAAGTLPFGEPPQPVSAAAQSLKSSACVFCAVPAARPSGSATLPLWAAHVQLSVRALAGQGQAFGQKACSKPCAPTCIIPTRPAALTWLRAASSADMLQCHARSGLLVRFHLQLFSCHYFKDELRNT